MSNKPKKKSDVTTIKTGANLTIENISDVYQKFKDELNKHDTITFEPGVVEEIDLTGIQFLHYLQKWEEKKGVVIINSFKFSENASQLLTRTGFSYLLPAK